MATSFNSWYSKPENKKKLNERRRIRYQGDAALREKAKVYQSDYRQRVSADKPNFVGFTREEVCTDLGITTWVFNSWRAKGYFPAPTKILGRVSILENQKSLIGMLATFHNSHGVRLSPAQRQELKTIIEIIHQNWVA